MSILQFIRGNFAYASAYVAQSGEPVFDETNGDLRIGDGSTPGGKLFPNRDNLDARYQEKNDELVDFGEGFGPSAKGFTVRIAPANYVLRSFAVSGDLELSNPAGEAGNPTFSLKATLEDNYTFSGNVTFSGTLAGTFTGDVTGNVTGNVTGDVTGDLLGNSFGVHTGALDATGENVYFDPASIPWEAIANPPEAPLGIPIGGIIIWSGAADAIPSGWFLCDGSNGTPDLQNRFVVGAGDTYAVGATGGSTQHSHVITIEADGAHTHVVNVDDHTLTLSQIPAHKHHNGVCDNTAALFNHGGVAADPTTSDSIESNNSDSVYEGYTSEEGGGNPHNHGADSESAGSHTHVMGSEDTSHLPPYYAMCYIMKGAE